MLQPALTSLEPVRRAAVAGAVMERGRDLDCTILAATPMAAAALIFGNPRPSDRPLQQGDIIIKSSAIRPS